VVGTTQHEGPVALHPRHRRNIVAYLSMDLWVILNWMSKPFSIEIWEVFPDMTVTMPVDCSNCILCSGKLPASWALLTINIIFEVQFFVGGSVVKIPACV